MDSLEGAIIAWEEGLTAFEHTQVRVSSSRSKQLTDLGLTLEECQILLCLQETDLEV
jgi:hypothetical protein